MPKTLLALVLMLVPIYGCGPKEIGEGSSYRTPTPRDAAVAEDMRFPMTGTNNTQQKLYYYTRPDMVENYQGWQLRQYRRIMGVAPNPEDPAWRETPKQRSPFRQ